MLPTRKFNLDQLVICEHKGNRYTANVVGYEDGRNNANGRRPYFDGWIYHVRLPRTEEGHERIIVTEDQLKVITDTNGHTKETTLPVPETQAPGSAGQAD